MADDDARDLGPDLATPWVVRRTTVAVAQAPASGEVLTLTTFVGGLGSRWAERRTSVAGDAGASVEASSVWVSIDPRSGAPRRLARPFLDAYGEAAGGRTVGVRLRHEPPPDGAGRRPWALRSTDHDPLGHVNNAAAWEPVEDELDRRGRTPAWAEVEYRAALEPADQVTLVSDVDAEGTVRVWLTVDGRVRSSAVVRSPP